MTAVASPTSPEPQPTMRQPDQRPTAADFPLLPADELLKFQQSWDRLQELNAEDIQATRAASAAINKAGATIAEAIKAFRTISNAFTTCAQPNHSPADSRTSSASESTDAP